MTIKDTQADLLSIFNPSSPISRHLTELDKINSPSKASREDHGLVEQATANIHDLYDLVASLAVTDLRAGGLSRFKSGRIRRELKKAVDILHALQGMSNVHEMRSVILRDYGELFDKLMVGMELDEIKQDHCGYRDEEIIKSLVKASAFIEVAFQC